ncbi:MAG: cobyric acid synthase [Nitrospirae bacterium]|nr:cobyric acid synthase [Nitrospirota bacterium]
MAKALMFQGTGSGVGKSFIVAALCKILKDMGYRVAPFKAQNMALNSYVTKDGGEIGRAQALQAEAAGLEPSVYMNPVLLKAEGEKGAQVILLGRVHSTMTAKNYYEFKDRAWQAVVEGWKKISSQYDVVVIEGAGSPAEINLMDKEIVNMAVARLTDAPVVLIGDIDRGGVFASLYGTVKLLGEDARFIKGFVINKFRGDIDILKPGNELIEQKTGIPVLGVLPYLKETGLPEEDGLSLSNERIYGINRSVKITVLRIPFISNFTDFDPFIAEPEVSLFYSLRSEDILSSDMVIVPGSKNTMKDLRFLKQQGIDETLRKAVKKGIPVVGICGGYQMLGQVIRDPELIEGTEKETRGIGLLETETVFERPKVTCQLKARMLEDGPFFSRVDEELSGYEIHMGRSEIKGHGLFSIKRIPHGQELMDGTTNGLCWGTYIHGIFDNDALRWQIIQALRQRRGLPPTDRLTNYREYRLRALENWARIVRENIDMNYLLGLLNLDH